jgi:acyl carrier protein
MENINELENSKKEGFSLEYVTEMVTRVTADQLEIEPSEISLEKRFIKDLKADSLDIMEINMELEKMLKIEVPDYCIGFIVTVEDAVTIIYRVLNGLELPYSKTE